jgi:hypothetical protein
MSTKIRFAEACEFMSSLLLVVMTGWAGWKAVSTYCEWGELLGSSIPIWENIAKAFIRSQLLESLRLCGIGWMIHGLFVSYRIVVQRKETERV